MEPLGDARLRAWPATAAPPASATRGPLDAPVAQRDRGERPGRRGRPVGQPQLRGPHPPAGPGQLPRLAAARGRLRAGRARRHRPDDASRSAPGRDGAARLPGRHLAVAGRGPRRRSRDAIDAELFRRTYAVRLRRRRALAGAADPGRRPLRLGRRLDLRRRAALLRGHDARRRTRSPTSPAPACWPCSATRSRPTTSRPAGSIAAWSPGRHVAPGARRVAPLDFNSYGARRGHHEVMMRGTFGNIRLRNAPGRGQGGTVHRAPARPDRRDVHLRRRDALPGRGRAAASSSPAREYGSGSSRDWAAKGTAAARRPGGASRRASSGSTAPTWSAWACCRCSSCRARAPPASA